MRMLDLFCGRFGWGRTFAERGWEVVGVDLVAPPEIPPGCTFIQRDILTMTPEDVKGFDFICASSPCEQFSVHGLKCFFPNPPHPEIGIKLFQHTMTLCEASGAPWVMENVRAAQQFVGNAVHHCGPFYLWGTGVPALMHQGIIKGNCFRGASGSYMARKPEHMSRKEWRMLSKYESHRIAGGRKNSAALAAIIPLELATNIVDYAERICDR